METRKLHINVIAEFLTNGHLMPLAILLFDGRCYPVDQVIDVKRAANLKVGGAGTKYTCVIEGQRRSLWREGDRWFVEQGVEE